MALATQIMLGITGQDQTGDAFASVASRATKAGSALKRNLGLITAGLGIAGVAYAAKKAVNEMSTISDRAQQMGVTADYAQKLAGALDQVGIKGVSLDSLADTFSKMTKETGATGAKGFEETLAAIASIGDEGGRVEALAKTFGRSLGPNLAPLVRQGPDALRQGLADVMAAMPGISDAAANAGDLVSDALKIAANTGKVAWQQALGEIIMGIENTFGMPFAEAMATALANVKWAVSTIWLAFSTLFGNIGKVIQFFRDDWRGALEWVWNGVKAYLGAVFAFWVQVFKSIGSIAVSFGKQVWSAIKGDGFDWGAIVDDANIELGNVAEKYKDMWAALIPSSNNKIQFDIIDWDKQFAKRDELIAAGRKGVQAQALLASGGVIEDVAADAVKAIKDAAKEQSFTEAGTYAALKLQMGNRGAAAAGVSAFGGASAPGGYASSTAQARQESGLMSKLIEVAQSIRAAVSDLSASCKRLEAI
jgi:hypothetical protein